MLKDETKETKNLHAACTFHVFFLSLLSLSCFIFRVKVAVGEYVFTLHQYTKAALIFQVVFFPFRGWENVGV